MGSLQTELVRVKLVDPKQHGFDLNIQGFAPELQQALCRLKALESKFPLMEKSMKFMLVVQHATARTVDEKVVATNCICDYLDTL